LKPQSQKIIISGVNTTETNKIILYTDGILSSQFSMDHGPNLRTTEHSTNIQPDKRGKSEITLQCSSLAIKLHSASLVSAETTLTAIE